MNHRFFISVPVLFYSTVLFSSHISFFHRLQFQAVAIRVLIIYFRRIKRRNGALFSYFSFFGGRGVRRKIVRLWGGVRNPSSKMKDWGGGRWGWSGIKWVKQGSRSISKMHGCVSYTPLPSPGLSMQLQVGLILCAAVTRGKKPLSLLVEYIESR